MTKRQNNQRGPILQISRVESYADFPDNRENPGRMMSGVGHQPSTSGFSTAHPGEVHQQPKNRTQQDAHDDGQNNAGHFHFVTVNPCSEQQKLYNKSIVRSHASKRLGRPNKHRNSALASSLNANTAEFRVFHTGKRRWTSKRPKMKMRLNGIEVGNGNHQEAATTHSIAPPTNNNARDDDEAVIGQRSPKSSPAITSASEDIDPPNPPHRIFVPINYDDADRSLQLWMGQKDCSELVSIPSSCGNALHLEVGGGDVSLYGFDYVKALDKREIETQETSANVDISSFSQDSTITNTDPSTSFIHKALSSSTGFDPLCHPRAWELRHYVETQQWPGFLRNPDTQQKGMLYEWYQLMRNNQLVLACCLYGALAHQQIRRSLSSTHLSSTPEELLERSLWEEHAIKLLKETATDVAVATSDETIFALLWMAVSRVDYSRWRQSTTISQVPFADLQWLDVYGGLTIDDSHLRAMRAMIDMKGGLGAIRIAGLAQALSTFDILLATKYYAPPHYSFVGIYPETASGNTPGWPTTFDAQGYRGHEGYSDPISDCSLPSILTQTLRNIQDYTAMLSKYVSTTEAPEASVIADRRKYIQFQAVSLPERMAPEDFTCKFQELAYGPLRFAVLLYSMWIVFPLPPINRPFVRLSKQLKTLLRNQDLPDAWSESSIWSLIGRETSSSGSPHSSYSATARRSPSTASPMSDHGCFQPTSNQFFGRSIELCDSGSSLQEASPSPINLSGASIMRYDTPRFSECSTNGRNTPLSLTAASRLPGSLHLLLWVIVMGGIAADLNDRTFYVDVLAKTCKSAGVTTWPGLRDILTSVAWVDRICDIDALPLWNETLELL